MNLKFWNIPRGTRIITYGKPQTICLLISVKTLVDTSDPMQNEVPSYPNGLFIFQSYHGRYTCCLRIPFWKLCCVYTNSSTVKMAE